MEKINSNLLTEANSTHIINNVYNKVQLRQIINNPELPVQFRQTVVASTGGEIGAILAGIIGLIFPVNTPMMILAIWAALQTPVIFALLGVIIKENDGAIAKYFATGMLILELPIIYCFSGGYEGPGLFWYLFAVLIATLVCPRKHALIEVACATVIQITIMIIAWKKPEIVFAVNPQMVKLNTLFSCFAIAVAIFLILYLQKALSKANDTYLRALKADVDEQNRELQETKEELIAQNEEVTAINEELRETSEKLSNMLDENRRAFDQQLRFTAMLNHELRNPLNGIMGYLQLQLLDTRIPEQFKRGIQDSYTLTESMLQTVNDILDFSKMQEGKFEIVRADFGLNDVIHNIHTIFDEMAENKGLGLVYNVPEKEYTLFSDGIRIQQIIVNLMSNAVKYTQRGKVTLEVDVDEVESSLNIRISDTGRGMTPDEVSYIYEPYKRFDLENNKKIQGTGLGMSIVKNLMDQLDGIIRIDSEYGRGTTFIISIPVAINKVATVNKKKADDNVEIDLSGKVILAVDDDSINLKILTMVLYKTNAIVISAKNGREALNIVELGDYKIDCIVTDNLMPEMTGYELKQYMNEHDIKIPSIVLTGATDAESVEQFKSVGFDGILAKPVIHGALFKQLKELI